MSHVEKMRSNIVAMNSLAGFSVVIVCCSNSHLSNYWQTRLEHGRGSVIAEDTLVLTVFEDWPGGAGNGLGTLYAFQNAAKLALEKHGKDIMQELADGKISVGLYHTAGKGTRLAPLPGSENNNKPGVKLPGTIVVNGKVVCITILESVIKQTGCYAGSRPGRVSVFWGDQIFIPTVEVAYTCTDHVDILCSLGPMMSESEWSEKGMDKYGLIAKMSDGRVAQVEKVSHATATELLKGLGEIVSVGVSLGSFSVSAAILAALLATFDAELQAKQGKLDTDPHFWMPMTLQKSAYIYLMEQKKVSREQSEAHFDRIHAMLDQYHLTDKSSASKYGLFGACDVGTGIYWWDYGQLKFFQKNTLLITEKSEEAALMRLFFNGSERNTNNDTIVDEEANSCILNSLISTTGNSSSTSSIRNSVICGVKCNTLRADGCILMNVVARSITAAPGSIVYNIVTEDDIVVTESEVMVGVFNNTGDQLIVRSHLDTDGGVFWDKPAVANQQTFGEIYSFNESIDPAIVESVIHIKQAEVWAKIESK